MKITKILITLLAITILGFLLIGCEPLKEQRIDGGSGQSGSKPVVRYSLESSVFGGGTVALEPKQDRYEAGSFVNLKAVPATGYYFSHWEGALEGSTNPVDLQMNGPRRVRALFYKTGTGIISGVVLHCLGGLPLEGAKVTVEGTAHQAVTDVNGRFTIIDVKAGQYSLLVSKAGRAFSRRQAVMVTEKETTELELILPQSNGPSTDAPTITVSGLVAGTTYEVPTDITINVTSPQPVESTANHDVIYLKIANFSGVADSISSKTGSFTYSFDPNSLPPGEHNIQVVAYDRYSNRSQLDIQVVTKGQVGKLHNLRPRLEKTLIWAETFGSIDTLYRSAIDRKRAQVYIQIEFLDVVDGLSVYRADSESGPYKLVGRSSETIVRYGMAPDFVFTDVSHELRPGSDVWYKFAFYTERGEWPMTTAVKVPILPYVDTRLVSPADNEVFYHLRPVLEIDHTYVSGVRNYLMIFVEDVETGEVVFERMIFAPKKHQELRNLQYGKTYEWYVNSTYELVNGNIESHSYLGEYPFTVIERRRFTIARE